MQDVSRRSTSSLQGIRQFIELIPVMQELNSDHLMHRVGATFAALEQKAHESGFSLRSFVSNLSWISSCIAMPGHPAELTLAVTA
jgi:hypothetical protein